MATVCLSGLDLSFLKNSKPIILKRPKRGPDKSSPLGGPMIMSDIKEFVANATDKPELITSRSQLARYERSNNIRQVGNDLKGRIVADGKKRVARDRELVQREARRARVDLKWV
jgi:hypothetical protein